jgi:hypothetical protein
MVLVVLQSGASNRTTIFKYNVMKLFYILFFVFGSLEVFSITNYFYVDVEVNNVSLKLLIDNGATNTVLFKKILKPKELIKLNSKNIEDKEFVIYGSKKTIDISVKIDSKIKKSSIYVLQMDSLSDDIKALGFDGLLGRDVLSQFNWHFDYTSGVATPLDKNKELPIQKNNFFAIDFFGTNADTIKSVKINNFLINNILIDLGCNCHVLASNSICKEELFQISKSYTINDVNTVNKYHLSFDTLSIANELLKNIPIECQIESLNKKNVIGNLFFNIFDEVYFDYSKKQILIKKFETKDIFIPKIEIHNNKIKTIIGEKLNSEFLIKKIDQNFDTTNGIQKIISKVEFLTK